MLHVYNKCCDEKGFRCWRDGSVLKTFAFLAEGTHLVPRTHGGLQLSIIPVPGGPASSSVLLRYQEHTHAKHSNIN